MMSKSALALFLCAPLSAQFFPVATVTEVLFDPVGPNAGAQLVEVRIGHLPVDFTGWHLVTSAGAFAIPGTFAQPHTIARMHLGVAGISTQADLYMPAVPVLGAADSIALFRTGATSNAADLEDFVAWGGGQGAIAVAVQAGQWPSTLLSVLGPVAEGCSIAHFDQSNYGSPDVPEAWFVDCTPTLGLPNDGGGIFVGANGCLQLAFPPQLGSGAEDNRPWLGEAWKLDYAYLPPVPNVMFVAMSFAPNTTVLLAPFGMPNCYWEVPPDHVVVYGTAPSQGSIQVAHLPNIPSLAGVILRLQALVPYPGANAAEALATRVLIAHLGRR